MPGRLGCRAHARCPAAGVSAPEPGPAALLRVPRVHGGNVSSSSDLPLSGRAAADHPRPGDNPLAWWPCWLAAAVAVVTFAVTLRGTYIYDDLTVVTWDPRVNDPSLWYWYFKSNYMPGSGPDRSFRPITGLSFAVQWWLHGDRPWAFHLVNVLLHAATAGAVARFAGRLFAGRAWAGRAAGVAGLLFAVHPVHTEAVA